MRLFPLVLLLVVFGCVLGQAARKQQCRSTRNCREGEGCVIKRSCWYWFCWRSGVCKPIPPKRCQSGKDCGPDQCCESIAPVKGRKKRQIGGSDGVCKSLQNSGQKCLVKYPAGKPASTVSMCPCKSNFQCIPDENGLTGTCSIPKVCASGSDCGPNECCELSALRGRRKRQVAGVCKPLKTNGQGCLLHSASGKPGDPVQQCPCTLNLKCRPDGQTSINGDTGVCEAPQSCSSGTDCNDFECCQSLFRPKGRKKRQSVGGSPVGGVCEPLGTNGTNCLAESSSGQPAGMAFICPCRTGFTCKGLGVPDPPLGESGECKKTE